MCKTKRYYLVCLTILILSAYNSYGQISTDMVKYWYYRNRLNNYFVVPGLKKGESQIICVRNTIAAWNDANTDRSKGVDYGQHGKYTGLYLGVLATEYYLLKRNGQYADAAQTHEELYKALDAVKIFWDEAAEPFYGSSMKFNGFFIRGNVPCDFLKRQTENLIS